MVREGNRADCDCDRWGSEKGVEARECPQMILEGVWRWTVVVLEVIRGRIPEETGYGVTVKAGWTVSACLKREKERTAWERNSFACDSTVGWPSTLGGVWEFAEGSVVAGRRDFGGTVDTKVAP